jgi:hypothetical protein
MNRRQLIGCVAAIAVIAGAAWFFLPQTKCCEGQEAGYQEYDRLVRGAINGDVEASRQLYADALAAGSTEDARRWAMVGALDGSAELAAAYLSLYKLLPADRKVAEQKILKKNTEKPGGARLLAEVQSL